MALHGLRHQERVLSSCAFAEAWMAPWANGRWSSTTSSGVLPSVSRYSTQLPRNWQESRRVGRRRFSASRCLLIWGDASGRGPGTSTATTLGARSATPPSIVIASTLRCVIGAPRSSVRSRTPSLDFSNRWRACLSGVGSASTTVSTASTEEEEGGLLEADVFRAAAARSCGNERILLRTSERAFFPENGPAHVAATGPAHSCRAFRPWHWSFSKAAARRPQPAMIIFGGRRPCPTGGQSHDVRPSAVSVVRAARRRVDGGLPVARRGRRRARAGSSQVVGWSRRRASTGRRTRRPRSAASRRFVSFFVARRLARITCALRAAARGRNLQKPGILCSGSGCAELCCCFWSSAGVCCPAAAATSRVCVVLFAADARGSADWLRWQQRMKSSTIDAQLQ